MKNYKIKPKTVLIFILIVLGCFAGGCLIGFLLAGLDADAVSAAGERALPVLRVALPVFYVAVNLGCLLVSILYIRKSETLVSKANDDDDSLTEAEGLLSPALLLGGVITIVNMFLFSASAALADRFPDARWIMPTAVAMMILGIVWSTVVVSVCVRDVEKLNPEKRGSPLELHFSRTWEESCDEGQRLLIYKAAYKAYTVTSRVCLFMWVAALICQLLFHTGILPSLCICAIDLVLTISYYVEGGRLETRGRSLSAE